MNTTPSVRSMWKALSLRWGSEESEESETSDLRFEIPLLLHLINAASRRRELLFLDERLIDDAAEVGAVAGVAALLHRIDNIADAHRLTVIAQDAFDHIHQAHLVARASPGR